MKRFVPPISIAIEATTATVTWTVASNRSSQDAAHSQCGYRSRHQPDFWNFKVHDPAGHVVLSCLEVSGSRDSTGFGLSHGGRLGKKNRSDGDEKITHGGGDVRIGCRWRYLSRQREALLCFALFCCWFCFVLIRSNSLLLCWRVCMCVYV